MLTREVCNNLWPEIEAELGALFERYGVSGKVTKCVLTREGAQESAGRFATFTLQVSEVQDDGEVLTPERMAFAHYAPMHGISADWLDREFTVNGQLVRWAWVSRAPRKRSQDEVALDRQRRMRRRMQKKYPLFAEWAIQQEMEKRPAYYAGETDAAREQAKVALETRQRQRLARLIAEYEEREKSASADPV